MPPQETRVCIACRDACHPDLTKIGEGTFGSKWKFAIVFEGTATRKFKPMHSCILCDKQHNPPMQSVSCNLKGAIESGKGVTNWEVLQRGHPAERNARNFINHNSCMSVQAEEGSAAILPRRNSELQVKMDKQRTPQLQGPLMHTPTPQYRQYVWQAHSQQQHACEYQLMKDNAKRKRQFQTWCRRQKEHEANEHTRMAIMQEKQSVADAERNDHWELSQTLASGGINNTAIHDELRIVGVFKQANLVHLDWSMFLNMRIPPVQKIMLYSLLKSIPAPHFNKVSQSGIVYPCRYIHNNLDFDMSATFHRSQPGLVSHMYRVRISQAIRWTVVRMTSS